MGAGQPGALQDQHGDQVLQPGACWQTGLGSVQGEAGQPLSFPSRPTPDMRLIHPPAGGFATFSSCFPGLCEGKPATLLPMSLSQPCLPVPSVGLTRILPHLYLGSQKDVLNKVCVQPEPEPLLGWSGVGRWGAGVGELTVDVRGRYARV